MDTLATIHGPAIPAPEATAPDKVLTEHNRRVATVKAKVKAELEAVGHTTDDEVRLVDNQYVGLFVLPSQDHLYVGYGRLGGSQAYRGPEDKFDAAAVATAVIAYLKTTT